MRILKSLLFLVCLELLYDTPGGLLELILRSKAVALRDDYICLVGILFSATVLLIVISVAFPDLFRQLLILLKSGSVQVIRLLAYLVGMYVSYILIGYLSYRFGLTTFKELSNVDTQQLISRCILYFFVAIAEEMVYRGIALSFFLKRMKPWLAIAIISSVFSILHLYSGILDYILAFELGVITSLIVLKTNSLYGAIGLHLGWNLAFDTLEHYLTCNLTILTKYDCTLELMLTGLLLIVILVYVVVNFRHSGLQLKYQISSSCDNHDQM